MRPAPAMSDPGETWADLEAKLATTTDALGLGVDQAIRETVAGLWAHGVETTMSCEGHDDRGCAMPWVDIESRYSPARPSRVSPSDREAWRRTSMRSVFTVSELLSEFYEARAVAWRAALIMKPLGYYGRARLECMCANESLRERKGVPADAVLVAANRAEMREFGAWLHARFLRGATGGAP